MRRYFLEYMEKLKEFNEFAIENESEIASYYKIRIELDNLGQKFRTFITKPLYLIPFLQPGRLVKVNNLVLIIIYVLWL